MFKPICFIGARGGSKVVPRKNIHKIAGKPLIAYSIETALASNIFSHIVVSTEDKEIDLDTKGVAFEIFMQDFFKRKMGNSLP